MGEEEISVPVQLSHRHIDLRDHRVAGHVGAGHDQERVSEVREEVVVEPGIGKHAADGVDITDLRVGRMIPLFEDNDRVDRAFEQSFVLRGYECELVDMVRPDHDRKRLLDPAEAVLERARRLLDAREVEPADPPHGKDEPGIEQPGCLPDRVGAVNGIPYLVVQGKLRATVLTRNRLRMVAPGVRVAVFPRAGRAHRKVSHGRPLAVIGDFADDAVSGPAVHARRGPVILIPSPGLKNIGNALRADRDVGRDHAGVGTGPAWQDDKTIRDLPDSAGHFHRIDPGERGAP